MITWLRKLSWKWKILIAFIVLSIFLMGFIVSDWGQDWMREKITTAYNNTPDAEKRDSPWADYYLKLAWFCGNIRGDEMQAMEMYREFLGIKDNPTTKKNFFESKKLYGLCSEDGTIGWGPLHEKAPDAYYSYLELYEVRNSSQFTQARCLEYYYLLYDFVKRVSENKKPHPRFKKYWDRVLIFARKYNQPLPSDIKQSAPEAPSVGSDE
jgi:hypothetical protein